MFGCCCAWLFKVEASANVYEEMWRKVSRENTVLRETLKHKEMHIRVLESDNIRMLREEAGEVCLRREQQALKDKYEVLEHAIETAGKCKCCKATLVCPNAGVHDLQNHMLEDASDEPAMDEHGSGLFSLVRAPTFV